MRYFLFLLGVVCFQLADAQCEDSVINCPGECSKFTDENNDLICDNSIIDSSLLHKQIKSTPATPKKNQATKPAEPSTVPKKEMHSKPDLVPLTTVNQNQSKQVVQSEVPQKKRNNSVPYHFFSIALPLIALYILLLWLSNKQKIRKTSFLKIWNTLLLLTFVVTAALGLLLTVKMIYHLQIPYIKLVYLVHVDFGVAMSVITLFHLIRHWRYYRNLVK